MEKRREERFHTIWADHCGIGYVSQLLPLLLAHLFSQIKITQPVIEPARLGSNKKPRPGGDSECLSRFSQMAGRNNKLKQKVKFVLKFDLAVNSLKAYKCQKIMGDFLLPILRFLSRKKSSTFTLDNRVIEHWIIVTNKRYLFLHCVMQLVIILFKCKRIFWPLWKLIKIRDLTLNFTGQASMCFISPSSFSSLVTSSSILASCSV